MLSLIAMYPAASFTGAAVSLIAIFYTAAFGARIARCTLVVLILAPLWPILIVRFLALTIVNACDWLLEKPWTAPFVGAARLLSRNLDRR